MIKNIYIDIKSYFLFLHSMFTKPVSWKMFWRQVIGECVQVGVDSLFIVTIISIFMGGASYIQLDAQVTNPFVSKSFVSFGVRNMIISELSPTVIGIVFAGKVGASIASELGTMRISEQIDALEIMGINPNNYLVLPKIIATMFMYPFLVIISIFLALYGGFLVCKFLMFEDPQVYIHGIRNDFQFHSIVVAIYKSIIFAFFISSISCFKGLKTECDASSIGRASTKAVTASFIAILITDLLLVYMLFK